MSYSLSRTMSAATATYSVYALADPGHLGRAIDGDEAGFELLAQTFGVRDFAISTFGLLGRSDRTVRTAMWIRIACDIGDGVLLSARADDDETRAKILGVTLTWATLNYLALRSDKRRARRRETEALAEKAVLLGVKA